MVLMVMGLLGLGPFLRGRFILTPDILRDQPMKCPHFQLCTAEARPISKLQVNTILSRPKTTRPVLSSQLMNLLHNSLCRGTIIFRALSITLVILRKDYRSTARYST